jgi:hypothetical protein
MNQNQFRGLMAIMEDLAKNVDKVIQAKFPDIMEGEGQEYIFFKKGQLYARYSGQDIHIDSPDELSLSVEELKEKYKEEDI